LIVFGVGKTTTTRSAGQTAGRGLTRTLINDGDKAMSFARGVRTPLLIAASVTVASIDIASGQDAQNGVDTIVRNQNLNSNPNRETTYDRFAISGKKTRLGYYYAVKLNCQPEDWVEVSISKQPEHGKATLRDETTVMSYGKDNVDRHAMENQSNRKHWITFHRRITKARTKLLLSRSIAQANR
jgi:hypothetical protein